MEIAPGIHWIDRVRANVYACLDGEEVTLIDSGWSSIDRVDLIFNYLERLHLFPLNLKRILLTHADSDHAGNAAALQRESGAIVMCSAEARPHLTAGVMPPRPTLWLARLLARFSRYPAVAEEHIRLLDGSNRVLPVLGGLRVVPTPGHTPGHLSFFHPPSGVLLAGDALNTRRGRLQFTPALVTEDRTAAWQSARNLFKLAPTVIACGHGPPLKTHTAWTIVQKQYEWGTDLRGG